VSAPFELLRFTGAPAGPDVAVLELEGTFPGGAGRDHQRARLLVENAERSLELSPVTTVSLRDGTWRATYALALGHMQGATYALAVGRTLLLDLPVPDLDAPGGAAAQHVRLARETNELRARLDEALAAREEADERAGTAADELATERAERADIEKARDRASSEARSEKEARERAETAVAEARRTADEQLAAARADSKKELEAVREEHAARLHEAIAEAERGREEALAAERAHTAKAAHDLRAARAELESLRREASTPRAAPALRVSRRASGNGEAKTEVTKIAETTEATKVVERETDHDEPTASAAAETAPAPIDSDAPWSSQGTEAFRVLTPRAARPRHRIEDEPEPEELPPGAAATGARSFEHLAPGRPSSSTRALAVAALAVAMLAALLVIVLRVGLV
jgi:hypothetical protein